MWNSYVVLEITHRTGVWLSQYSITTPIPRLTLRVNSQMGRVMFGSGIFAPGRVKGGAAISQEAARYWRKRSRCPQQTVT